jgi:hypothetical protein
LRRGIGEGRAAGRRRHAGDIDIVLDREGYAEQRQPLEDAMIGGRGRVERAGARPELSFARPGNPDCRIIQFRDSVEYVVDEPAYRQDTADNTIPQRPDLERVAGSDHWHAI